MTTPQPVLRIRTAYQPPTPDHPSGSYQYDRESPAVEAVAHFARWCLANPEQAATATGSAYYHGHGMHVTCEGWACPTCDGTGELPFQDRCRESMDGPKHYTVGGGTCPCCEGAGTFPDAESFPDALDHAPDDACNRP